MLRTIDFVLIALMIAAAATTYQVKHRAEEKLTEVRRLEAEIRLQEDTIDLLRADWSLLNQPGRLQTLIETFNEDLQLATTEPQQIATPSELPARQIKIEDLIADELIGGYADATITGSVVR